MKPQKKDASPDGFLKAIAERQDALESQLDALVAAVESLEKRLAKPNDPQDFSAQEGTIEVQIASTSGAPPPKKHTVKAEVRAVIAAAAAVAGEVAKVRKARALPAVQDAGNAWSQQGRVGVVSSHNVR